MSLLLHLTEEKTPEIFETIQGEGVDMGLPAFFIRLQGCSVHCFFCDEKETWVKRENNSITVQPEEILSKLEELNPLLKRVVITGGEPTEQNLKPLISLLIKNNFKVSVETAATGEYLSQLFDDYSEQNSKPLNITFSPKEPYSKTSKIQDEKIWARSDEVKFVVANEEALDYVINTIISKLKIHNNPCPIFLVPDWYNFEKTKTLVLKLLREYPSYFRLGTQLHKIMEMP